MDNPSKRKRSGGWLAKRKEVQEFRIEQVKDEMLEDFLIQVEALLDNQGLSRSDLARRMGCKPENVTRLMSGERNMTLKTMAAIAEALECKIEVEVVTL